MCSVFKMSNHIFDYGLSANELHIYTVLCSVYSSTYQHDIVTIKQSLIAEKCGFKTAETVSRGIATLCGKGLIKRAVRFIKRNGDLGTYHYTITLPQEQGNYFYVSRKIIGKLNSIQMRMYLFICKCLDSRTGECWNSYNDIANALRIKRTRVIETIKQLISLNVIERIRKRKADGSYSDNHYRLLNIVASVRKFFKKKESRFSQNLLSLSTILNVQKYRSVAKPLYFHNTHYTQVCQVLFFATRGSPLNQGSFIEPTMTIQREKMLRFIYQHSRFYL